MTKPLIVWIIVFALTIILIIVFNKKAFQKITGNKKANLTNFLRLVVIAGLFISTVVTLLIKYIMNW